MHKNRFYARRKLLEIISNKKALQNKTMNERLRELLKSRDMWKEEAMKLKKENLNLHHQISMIVHGLRTILDRELESAETMPTRTDEEFLEILSTNKDETGILFHDGTEREIPRPQDEEEQKENYSGKKKKHTVKNAVIVSCCCTILYISQTLCGNVHDKRIADKNYTFPSSIVLYQDSGYQGFHPEGVTIIQPTKEPKGKLLTEQQKTENRKISSVRVLVEHIIGSTKRCRIVKDECRLRKNDFIKHVLHTCAALHNFRIKINPFRYNFN
ncbi:MAG: transposase family protein [Prevotellaceae bacterium]|nr:transposase family protein [Prevotellaceae bacterium]